MNAELDQAILDYLKAHPASLAREVADALGVDKRQINSRLYAALKGRVEQDRSYRWSLAGQVSTGEEAAGEAARRYPDTVLSRLARYYLACLGHDEGGVSVFAASRHELDYRELPQLPGMDGAGLPVEELRAMQARRRRDRSPVQLYFGYPVMLGLQRSRRSNWQGFMVEPLFLFPLRQGAQGGYELDLCWPVINQKAYRRLTHASGNQVMDEIVQLEGELGLVEADVAPDLDELALRLQAVRSEWPWQEDIDPQRLSAEPQLSELEVEGIYNRAVLMLVERPPFTQGLESELNRLAMLPEGSADGTALGDWLSGQVSEAESESHALLEVLPMNIEQRQAVQSALGRYLTVITGPPGTGKSQVVTNLLINAAWRGQKVLFASKNNKAVDVVEVRVNGLGSRPTLLRVGSNQYMAGLAEYLISLLAATTTEEDELAYRELCGTHESLAGELEGFGREARAIIELRNRVDRLEQQAENARKRLGAAVFASLRGQDRTALETGLARFRERLQRADRSRQPLLTRLFWRWVSSGRYAALRAAAETLAGSPARLGLPLPETAPSDASFGQWLEFGSRLDERLEVASAVLDYFAALRELEASRRLEEIAVAQARCQQRMAENALHLWDAWLRLQPGRLAAGDRELINRYAALLKMVLDQGASENMDRAVYREYYKLFPQVSHLLPCWAVTSLSARGKVPFEPGYFDLVVFDEASQCDIASALPLLYRAKRAVVIGDPRQLSHISALPRGQDQKLLERFDLLGSYPHWGYAHNSLFDLAAGHAGSSQIIALRDHHRSQADIIEFSNRYFYEGRLRVATRYDQLRRPAPDAPGIRWVDVQGRVVRPASGGAVNEAEVEMVVKVLADLVLQKGYRGSVGVVSPFRLQANRIREEVNKLPELSQRLLDQGFIADTVHKFQGDERDVMIFSPVVSTDTPNTALGFLRSQGNLFNVAITRARAQLVVVGDRAACGNSGVDYLEQFVRYELELENREERYHETQLHDLGPEYPAVANPEQVSEWEKILYRALYAAGIRTLPQYQVEKYALDLALIDGNRRLDIEVDGERYHRNWSGELCYRDMLRNQRMYELGWDVMRFWVYEVRDDLAGCVERVVKWKNDVAGFGSQANGGSE